MSASQSQRSCRYHNYDIWYNHNNIYHNYYMDRQTCHFCFCTLLINWLTGNFRAVQIFTFFEGRAVNAKIKTGINSHELVFYMQSLLVGGVVFWHWNANICEKFRGLSSNFVKIGTRENFPLFRYNNSYNHVEFVGDQVVPCNIEP